jgi:sugar phosphate isomerase/epimerase
MDFPISLFTACAPWLPLAELAPRAAAAGCAGLDLACKATRFDPARAPGCDNNPAVVPLAELPAQAPGIARLLAAHGLACPVLAGYAGVDDFAAARALALGARALGAPLVRLWTPAPAAGRVREQVAGLRAAWSGLAEIAAGEECRFVMETHEGTLATGASACLRLIDGLDPARVGVILDVANTVRDGTEALPVAIELLGPYLAHVHVKDVWVRTDGTLWNGLTTGFAPLGEGNLRWPAIIAALAAGGYRGWLALENFTGIERGPRRIGEDAAWLREQMARARTAQAAPAPAAAGGAR